MVKPGSEMGIGKIALLSVMIFVLSCDAPYAQKQNAKPVTRTANAYLHTDRQADFKGDVARYMSDHFQYPDSLEDGSSAPDKMVLVFTVDISGYLHDIKVEKSSGSKYCDENVVKMLRHMNDSAALWAPALLNGVPVNSIVRLPILTCFR